MSVRKIGNTRTDPRWVIASREKRETHSGGGEKEGVHGERWSENVLTIKKRFTVLIPIERRVLLTQPRSRSKKRVEGKGGEGW